MTTFDFANLFWGMSTSSDGSMRLRVDGTMDPTITANRERFFGRVGVDAKSVVFAQMVHGSSVAVVTEKDRGTTIPKTDALVTDQKGIVLAITVADCVPVSFFDPVRNVVGLAHAGWRGVRADIVGETIRTMHGTCGSNPSDIHVFIGPHIQAHHFEVKEDVASQFADHEPFIVRQDGKITIDLGGIIREQLIRSGLQKENIDRSDECTVCESEKYFSYRRDKPDVLETMVAYIGIRE